MEYSETIVMDHLLMQNWMTKCCGRRCDDGAAIEKNLVLVVVTISLVIIFVCLHENLDSGRPFCSLSSAVDKTWTVLQDNVQDEWADGWSCHSRCWNFDWWIASQPCGALLSVNGDDNEDNALNKMSVKTRLPTLRWFQLWIGAFQTKPLTS